MFVAKSGLLFFGSLSKFLKTWLVGDGLSVDEQMKTSKGTLIIPHSQFPPKKVRKECFYYTTPSMLTPKYLENADSCEVSTMPTIICLCLSHL